MFLSEMVCYYYINSIGFYVKIKVIIQIMFIDSKYNKIWMLENSNEITDH